MKLYGKIPGSRIIAEDDLFVIVRDKYPVSPGHTLVIVKRIVQRYHQLEQEEKKRLVYWIDWCLDYLQNNLHPEPDGFNVGLNDGEAAGQTMGQLHVHIIPRYFGDVQDPRGGVRAVIPAKLRYWH